MQMPINHEAQLEKGQRSNSHLAYGDGRITLAQLYLALSFEYQPQLRAVREYVDTCKSTLNEIHGDLSNFESDSDNSAGLSKAAERLGQFCMDADSWGFSSIHDVAFGLQKLLLDSHGQIPSDGFWKALNRGLAMLSALLDQCENDFRRYLAVADVLECLSRVDGNREPS